MTEHDGVQHGFLGQFAGFGFNHQNALRRAGDDQVQLGRFAFGNRRVQNEFAVLVPDARGADGPQEGQSGQRQSGGGGNHRDDVGIVFHIVRQNGAGDLRVVVVAFGEQRTNRTINQARRQNFMFGGTTFAAEETARNATGGIRFFLIVDRQGQEILLHSFGNGFSGANGAMNDGFAVLNDDGSVGLTTDFSGGDGQRTTAPFDFPAEFFKHRHVSYFLLQPLFDHSKRANKTNLFRQSPSSVEKGASSNFAL